MDKLKIGLLIRDFELLENWEMRIIKTIEDDPNLELVLLVKDIRFRNVNENINKFQFLKIGQIFTKFIFEKQLKYEKRKHLKNLKKIDREKIISLLEKIPCLRVHTKYNSCTDNLSTKNVEKIKKYKLDVILKHGFNQITGEIIDASKYGVWSLSHSIVSIQKGGPAGFWEVLNKEFVVELSLVKLTQDKSIGCILDKSYLNYNPKSLVITNNLILESSLSLLFKNLNKLKKGENLPTEVNSCKNINQSLPNLIYVIKYIYYYYNKFFRDKLKDFFSKFGWRYQCWTLFIGNGIFLETELSTVKPVKLPKGEFWADPFLFKYKGQQYVFYENYSYKEKKGKISCARVLKNDVIDIIDVLDLNYHLSYPYIFEEDGNVYLMPEASKNKRLELYKCIHFPDHWELFATAFEGEIVTDAFFFKDQFNETWLFLNKKSHANADGTSELYIYRVDSLELNKIEPHQQNPVMIDSRIARNGGSIFEYNGKLYRPSQSNTNGIYGKALNINEIEKLSIHEYSEKSIKKIEPNFQKGLISIHHLHQSDNIFVFDAAYKIL